MNAVVFEGVDRFVVADRPLPNLRDDEVLVRVEACGLCGTDLHILKGEYPSTFPLIPGHEFAGTIARVGPGVRDLTAGARVCVDPNIPCRICRFCREGKIHLCENLSPIGVRRDGGFAQFCPVPRPQVHPIPEHVSFGEAALVEPLSCALHGIDQADIGPGQCVLILGGGAIGGLLAQLARTVGAGRVIVSEPLAPRRKILLDLGVDAVLDPTAEPPAEALGRIEPAGPDVIFEAAGLTVTARQALTVAKRGATVVFFGVVAPHQTIEISPYEIYANEWTLRGSFLNPFTVRRAIDLLATRRIAVQPFISHQFPLDRFDQALRAFGQPDSFKIQLIPG